MHSTAGTHAVITPVNCVHAVQVPMFTGDDAKRTARFLRCALRRRLDGAAHELDGAADDPGVVVTGSHMLMYVATWWLICCMVVTRLLWTLLRALDAYRVL